MTITNMLQIRCDQCHYTTNGVQPQALAYFKDIGWIIIDRHQFCCGECLKKYKEKA